MLYNYHDPIIANAVVIEADIKDIMTRGFQEWTAVAPSGKLAAVWGSIRVGL